MTVEWVPIGSVLRRREDARPVEADAEYTMVGLLNRGRGTFVREVIRGSATKYPRLTSLRPGDLVFSKLFAWEGSVAIVDREGWVSSEFPTYEVNDSRVALQYLRNVIGWDRFIEQLSGATTGLGQRRQRVSPTAFEGARIPLPELETQRAIASRLDRIARVVGAVPIDRGLARSGAALVADSLRGWPARPLGEGLRRRDDAEAVVASGSYPMVGVRRAGRGAFASEVIAGEATKYRFLNKVHAGDLIYPKLGAWTGAFAIVPRELGGRWASPEFVTYEIDGDVLDAQFLEGLVSSDAFAQRVARLSVGTNMNRRRLSPSALEALPVSLPPLEEQRRIGRRLAALREATLLAARQRSLLDSLLPAARNEEFRNLLAS